MSTALSPIISEFETIEQENSYNEWLRTKVAASLADPCPAIPHDEVMAEMENLIAQIASTNRSE
ncbi:conserved domain protein [Escherichia coli TA280]|nr:conserved domain protein [Escherichia coli TA280]